MKAEDLVVLDVSEVSPLAEFFVLATGTGARHVTALAEEVVRVLKDLGARPDGVDGVTQGHWAVVDYGPVVVHCFQRQAREFYDLDMLWGDGTKVRWKPAAKRASA
jgi:ribosome-associated protein